MLKDKSFIGAAGVHYAAYRLTKEGMVALPTVRNTVGIDLIVTTHDGREHANIQVKTARKVETEYWPICTAKKFEGLLFGGRDYYLLLRPRRNDDPPPSRAATNVPEFEGFLLPAKEAKRELQASLDSRRRRGKEWKYPLVIRVDEGKSVQQWPEYKHRHWGRDKERWRRNWLEFRDVICRQS